MILRQREKKKRHRPAVSQTCLITGITRDTYQNMKPTFQALPPDPQCHNLQERGLVFFNKCLRRALWRGELGKQHEMIEKKNLKSYMLALTFLNSPYSNPWPGALFLLEQRSIDNLASPAALPTERKFTNLRMTEFRIPKSCISHYKFINRQDGPIIVSVGWKTEIFLQERAPLSPDAGPGRIPWHHPSASPGPKTLPLELYLSHYSLTWR